ncbi:MAG: hypothetical protein NTW64_02375 [Candidatus Omnitrophica bacterium]|nr:hypothetical protein [Candidatus Omnitrophota bacterium]
MLKKNIFLVALCALIAAPLYAQIGTPGLYTNFEGKFPPPQDPVECKAMILSQTDLELEGKAEDYKKQGKRDLAIAELQKISNQWAYHWFLSFLYESDFSFKEALGEVSWLMGNSECKELTMELKYRKEDLEEAIRESESWQERWNEKWKDSPPRDRKDKILEESF